MTSQCSPSRKLLLAIVTFIVLYSQVHVYVASQVGFTVKSTVAVVASKAALIVPAMQHNVFGETRAAPKASLTVGAVVRFFSSVNPLVHGHVVFL